MKDSDKLFTQQLLEKDRQYVWHPYSRVNSDMPLFPVASAKGCYLNLHSGEKLFDGMSSWWSTIHGYNHPRLNQALHQQIDTMSHVMFGGLTHQPAVDLAVRLTQLTPAGLDKVFLCDSGSVAVEVALKMAIQYWNSQGQQRSHFLTIKNGYHGDTFGAMSVCDPVTGMHQLFSGFLQENIFAEAPQCGFEQTWDDSFFENFLHKAQAHKDSIAAVILEPIVQGTGGMRFYSPNFLKKVRQLCDDYGILLIADEIATGFGRAGKLFACEYADISPDIMCLGKALTGGYMSMAATLCNSTVANIISQGEAGVFMHGPTFMANPLACSVANASITLLLENNWQQQVMNISRWLKEGLSTCEDFKCVNNVRVLGAIGVVELHQPVDMKKIQPLFVKHGIWLRPFGKLIYTMPPFISTQDDITMLTSKIEAVLRECYS
ncbi:adenosylmethionine--8-amino-7-oxononanoate transaminase [Agarilytica rhodophyticola]|uniref:adenosylmethionine--8-amino-7-oxononanoate transaminase n=1 Tax=Agarilytica rhodophyticola TaxID=1737490 RepID=UPI001C1FC552|nr:adenosylmethionine--8-amino-7-oxononanoate transaminase [Agarilytica rhodophyticola]